MINPLEIKQKAEDLYSKFLSAVVKGESFFPQKFRVGKEPKDWRSRNNEIVQLKEHSKDALGYGYNLELIPHNYREYARQEKVKSISIDTEEDYLKFINKEKEFIKFRQDIDLILLQVPDLKDWIIANPLKVIEHRENWENLLKVCQYFQKNPQPNLYIRELPIQVHTKFIEQNKGIISELLDSLLHPEVEELKDSEKAYKFEKRFSLKYDGLRIRLRILDVELKKKYNFPVSDFQTPIDEFRQLNFKGYFCIITENLMNFLTLPPLKNTFAIWGSGNQIQGLKSVNWLTHCTLLYWGDLDAAGFAILSRFRSYFPHTLSVMMDENTFKTFEEFVVADTSAKIDNLSHLTEEEYKLFLYLSQQNKRLEQECISQHFVNEYLQKFYDNQTIIIA